MSKWRTTLSTGLLLLVIAGFAQDEQAKRTDKEVFVVSYASRLQPISINRIHNWVIHVETADGSPIDNATIAVIGGMPLHDHGLPTMPQVTKYLGDGNYLVEGMRFHMNGWWQLTVSITVDSNTDSVTFELQL